MKLHTCQDYNFPHRKYKVVGFLIHRDQFIPNASAMGKIFSFVHQMSSHHGKVMQARWKNAEKRMIGRCKNSL